jgi:hypothetical protein
LGFFVFFWDCYPPAWAKFVLADQV